MKLIGSGGGTGGLAKNGGGTLTLRGPNSYSGPTVVNAGPLRLGNGSTNTSLADTAGVTLASGATLNLNYSGTDIVNALSVGGRAKSPGIYSASNSSFITGAGTLTVLSGPPGDYDIWRTANSVTGGPDHDDDRDGWSNHFEYSFGLNPALPSGNPVSFLSTALGPHLTYTRRKQSLTGLHYSIWSSSDLMSWSVDTGASQAATAISGTDVESVAVSLSPPMVPHARRFVRISASAP